MADLWREVAENHAVRLRGVEQKLDALVQNTMGIGRQMNHLAARVTPAEIIRAIAMADPTLDQRSVSATELREPEEGEEGPKDHADRISKLEEAFKALRKDMIGFGRQTNHLSARLDSLGTRPGVRSVAAAEEGCEEPTQRLMDAPAELKRAIAGDTRDPWAGRSEGMRCRTCIWFVPKGEGVIGRCRRHAPIMSGFPVVYPTDWCGDHRLDEGKL